MKYRWFDFSAEQPQEEPDLIKMARFLEREAERCSAYAPPETITQPRGDTITQMKRIQKTFFTSANRRETQNRTDRRVRAPRIDVDIGKKPMFLKIIPVRVAGPKKEIDTYALLDDGSTVTLIDSDLAQQLGARGRNEPTHRSNSENESRNEDIKMRSDQITRRVKQPTNICTND
ncbi:hypothetical protein EVAR_88207_1 [Eumeta japonica]|uniref:Uncharacterized protein n=1 Tax=Eumeta variegata TaxID=151549 RepID=A0A4C1ST01_EUMVA|nr:hypothetical protein EVAR_88207_1 [Eumeta japonica]